MTSEIIEFLKNMGYGELKSKILKSSNASFPNPSSHRSAMAGFFYLTHQQMFPHLYFSQPQTTATTFPGAATTGTTPAQLQRNQRRCCAHRRHHQKKLKKNKKNNHNVAAAASTASTSTYIFCCTNETYDECIDRGLFGTPTERFDHPSVRPTMSLLLYNTETRVRDFYKIFILFILNKLLLVNIVLLHTDIY